MLNMIMVTSQMVDLEHTLHFHQPILHAIEQRNPELAARLMTDHLNDARDLLLNSRNQEQSRKLRDHLAAGSPLHKLSGKADTSQLAPRPKANKQHLKPSRKS
jgi:GntR family transcriptional repressor for pyruvate dehydrogenase complex